MKRLLVILALLFAVNANAQYTRTFQQARCSADTANTTTSFLGTPLYFYVGANATYSFEFNLQTTSSATTGITYTLYYPSGATVRGGLIGVKKADTLATGVLTLDSTASAAFNTNSSGTYPMTIKGTIATGSTQGKVLVVFAKPTSGTATILKGSYAKAQRF